ncbi:hypothetical protein CCAX7_10290 [Capsulimonas corticalis]|uniref:Uncharacterized protein n=1 Tax=Capsulimonas corticalis TaxID=2219043 RepID=A0A402CUG0_9BACT|nr:hypothetical protein [Capsulimonas corticalis]BDI28978.1 hypothetical protein CCAX7_10290 [Capsulimonas corticalis]
MRYRTPEPGRLLSYLTLAALPILALSLLSFHRQLHSSTPLRGANARSGPASTLVTGASVAAPIVVLGNGPGASHVRAPGDVQIVDSHGRVVLCAKESRPGLLSAERGISLMNTGAAITVAGHSFPLLVVGLSRGAALFPGKEYALEQMTRSALQPGYTLLEIEAPSAPPTPPKRR